MENNGYDHSNEPVSNGTDISHSKGDNIDNNSKSNGARLERVLSVDEEVESRREEERNQDPLRLCRWIVDRPKTWFFSLLGSAWLMVLITVIMLIVGYDIIPIVFERLPLDIQDNEFYLRGLSWQFAHEDKKIYERGAEGDQTQALRSQVRELIMFVYNKPGGNVLTESNLKAIQKNEEEFFMRSDFQNDVCLLIGGVCSKPRSVLRFFDGTYLGQFEGSEIFNVTDFSDIPTIMNAAQTFDETKLLFEFIMPTDYDITADTAKASNIRSSFAIGWPLKGYSHDEDNDDDQLTKTEDFINDFIPDAQDIYEDGVGNMDFYYFSGMIFQQFVSTQVYTDMALLGGSICFIFLFMWFQTRSLFITGFAIMSIVTSFFIANMLYRVVFDYRYFGIFHVLALFIILGIGADDVFVFYDTWRESGHYQFKSMAHRLSFAYKRAALAMLWTSLTTGIAFIVSATSPFLGVNTFGVFAGLLVFVNYLSVITFLPCVIIMYHRYFERFGCCCCCPNKTAPDDTLPPLPEKKNLIVRFFHNYYFDFITHKVARWFIVAAYAALLGVFIYYATSLRPQEDQVKFLPDDTNFGGFIDVINDFSSGDAPQRVFIAFGLKEQDVSGCHRSDSLCFGDTVFDNSFNLDSGENQQALLDLCNTIRDLDDDMIKKLHIKRNVLTNQPEVYCFPQKMKDFMQDEKSRMEYDPSMNVTQLRYPNNTNLTYPVTQAMAETIMGNTAWIYDTDLEQDYNRWFEIGMEHWLYDGFQPGEPYTFDFYTYDRWLGVSKNNEQSVVSGATENGYIPYSFKYGTKLRYAAIVINTTIAARNLGYIEGVPMRDEWEEFVSGEISGMPAGLQNGYQCTPIDYDDFDLWHWLDVQRALVSSAVLGIIVGLVCALPILIIATMNVFVGIMATLNIACITVTVVGFIPMMGWKLGLLESLNLVLVVGLAVDYCVHLAEGYCRSTHYDRKGRLRDSLTEVGISVLSGCITTVGASAFMLLALILFFTQFGTFLFATLAFSFIYSIGFFTTCLGIFGPEGDTGSLKVLWYKLRACCKGNKKVDLDHRANAYSQDNNAVV